VTRGGAGNTTTFIVPVLDNPPESVTRTVKTLVPASGESGIPVKFPLLAKLSQGGPPTLPNVIASPLGSLAWAARLAE
jgi:hypothetical protein